MPPRAPRRVVESDAAATALRTASARSSPSARPAASAPLNVSPAPVVSIGTTTGAGTASAGPSIRTTSAPAAPRVTTTAVRRVPLPPGSARRPPEPLGPTGAARDRVARAATSDEPPRGRLGIRVGGAAVAQERELRLVRGEDVGQLERHRVQVVRGGRIQDRDRSGVPADLQRCPDAVRGDLPGDEHDVARAGGKPRKGGLHSLPIHLAVRPGGDRDQVLAVRIDHDQRDSRGTPGHPQAGEVDPLDGQRGTRLGPHVVGADRAHERHPRPEPSGRGRPVSALTAGEAHEVGAGHRLAGTRKPSGGHDEVDVDRSDHQHPSACHERIVADRAPRALAFARHRAWRRAAGRARHWVISQRGCPESSRGRAAGSVPREAAGVASRQEVPR